MILGLLVLVFIGLLIIVTASSRPEFPPLKTDPDDPLLLEARKLARASLPRFRELLRQYPKNGIVKLRFVSGTEQVEYLWAEVLEARAGEYQVRLVTPPVTHTGPLDRVRICKEEDIVDWQVTDAAGGRYGAFSQRAMFKIARRDGVKLPKKLEEIEKLYL